MFLFRNLLFLLISFSVFHSPIVAQTTPQESAPTPKWYVGYGPHGPFNSPDEACKSIADYVRKAYGSARRVSTRDWRCYYANGRFSGGTASMKCPTGWHYSSPGICLRDGAETKERKERRPSCEKGCDRKSAPHTPLIGNPVALETASKIQVENDYATADGLLRVDRHYSSRLRGTYRKTLTEPDGFGQHWLGLIPGRLSVSQKGSDQAPTDGGHIEYMPADGGLEIFTVTDQSNFQDYNFNNVSDTRLRLSMTETPGSNRPTYLVEEPEVPNGPGEMRLDFPNGDYTLYRRVGPPSSKSSNRHLMPVEHRKASGYSQYFDYTSGSTKPYQIRDSFNRILSLTWGAEASDQSPYRSDYLIESIGLPDGTFLKYEYNNGSAVAYSGAPAVLKNRLTAVKRVDVNNTVLWKRSYLYEYAGDPFALTGILDKDGNRLSTYGYTSGLASSTELASGVNKYTILNEVVNSNTVRRTVTNPLGRQTRYDFNYDTGSYYSPSRLLKVEGLATSSVPADIETYSYSGNLVTGHTDQNARSMAITNDAVNGRPTSVTEAAGATAARTTQITWHPTLDLPTQEVRDGLQIDYIYDGQGRLISRTEKDLTTLTVPYATFGKTRTTTFEWNDNGRIKSVNGPLAPDIEGRDDIVQFTYDTAGNLSAITNALGQATTFSNHDGNGRPATITDANGAITTFAYDLLGRTTIINRKHPTNATLDAVTTMTYDNEGRITSIASPLTDALNMAYDLAGRLLSVSSANGEKIEYSYDAMSNILSQTIRRTNSSASSTITRTFDSIGRMLTETLGPARTRTYTYDKVGNPVKVQSARGYETMTSFDALDRLVGVVTPDNATSSASYNSIDAQISSTDAVDVTTSFIRNGFGEVIREVSPDRGTSDYYYDASGALVAAIDGRGIRVDYGRDVLGRIISKTPVGTPAESISYSYDNAPNAIGRVTQVTDPSGIISFSYDHRGNVLTKTQNIGSGAATLAYTYNLADRIVSITYPSGRIVDYVRDGKGRVATVVTKENATANPITLVANSTYESFGSLKTASFGNGTTLLQDWGNDGLLANKRLYRNSDNSNISMLDYVYDLDDNITAINDGVTPGNSVTYAYDIRSRLTRTDSNQGPYARQDFLYDANGNRTGVEWRTAANDIVPAASDTYARTTGTNRLASLSNANGVRDFTHDARGNLISETRPGGVAVSASYDGYGRLTAYTQGTQPALAMVYNGLDDRVMQSESVGGLTDSKHYVYDAQGRMLGEYGTSALDIRAEYIYLTPDAANDNPSPYGGDDGMGGYGLLAIMAPDSQNVVQPLWIHSSHLGVPMLSVDANGQEVSPGLYAQPVFPGQVRTLADLYYNRYRDYDPTTGRYIQADPIGLDGGDNPYLYASGNPVRYIDPTGEFVPLIPILTGLALGAGLELGEQVIENWLNGRDLLDADCYDWSSVGQASLIGAVGGGVSGKYFLRYGSRSLTRITGKEWSHYIPRRWVDKYTRGSLRKALNKRGGLNGSWTSPKRHYKHDPFRYPKGNDLMGNRLPRGIRELDRTPDWLKGSAIAGGSGATIVEEEK